jgi:hypothetical protein
MKEKKYRIVLNEEFFRKGHPNKSDSLARDLRPKFEAIPTFRKKTMANVQKKATQYPLSCFAIQGPDGEEGYIEESKEPRSETKTFEVVKIPAYFRQPERNSFCDLVHGFFSPYVVRDIEEANSPDEFKRITTPPFREWNCQSGDGTIRKYQVEGVGVDWNSFLDKMIPNGWAKKINSTEVLLSENLEGVEDRMSVIFGGDFLKISSLVQNKTFTRISDVSKFADRNAEKKRQYLKKRNQWIQAQYRKHRKKKTQAERIDTVLKGLAQKPLLFFGDWPNELKDGKSVPRNEDPRMLSSDQARNIITHPKQI